MIRIGKSICHIWVMHVTQVHLHFLNLLAYSHFVYITSFYFFLVFVCVGVWGDAGPNVFAFYSR